MLYYQTATKNGGRTANCTEMAKAKPRAEAQLRATNLLILGKMERKNGISTANCTVRATDLLILMKMERKCGISTAKYIEMATNLLILM